MIDSHCHLDDPCFERDLDAVLARARAAGLSGFVLAGVSPVGWEAQEALSRVHDGMWTSVGLHPWICAHAKGDGEEVALVAALAARLARGGGKPPVAVGEIGLHRAADTGGDTLARQERMFRAQLRLAREHGLPVILHVLRAHERALAILREEGVPERGGVLHSFSGAAALVPQYVDLGLSFSFAGPVTYPNARRPIEALLAVPDERLLVETDAPDQMPQPAREEHERGAQDGEVLPRNEPANLPLVASAIARARGVSAEDLARLTAANTRRLFVLG